MATQVAPPSSGHDEPPITKLAIRPAATTSSVAMRMRLWEIGRLLDGATSTGTVSSRWTPSARCCVPSAPRTSGSSPRAARKSTPRVAPASYLAARAAGCRQRRPAKETEASPRATRRRMRAGASRPGMVALTGSARPVGTEHGSRYVFDLPGGLGGGLMSAQLVPRKSAGLVACSGAFHSATRAGTSTTMR